MQFSDTSTYLGVIQACERYCNLGVAGISGNATLLKEFTAHANMASRDAWQRIFKVNGNWQYDDANQTDLPQATTDLASGTGTYALPSTALAVKRLEVMDSNDEWTTLQPITLEEIPTLGEFLTETNDVPRYYRLTGNTIEVFPKPNYNSTAGLKCFFDRGSVAFANDDTTQAPGFASEFHDYIPVVASIEYLKVKQPNDATLAMLREDRERIGTNLEKFYGQRFKDKKPRVGRAYSNFK
jgi:hypothetical protein